MYIITKINTLNDLFLAKKIGLFLAKKGRLFLWTEMRDHFGPQNENFYKRMIYIANTLFFTKRAHFGPQK